MRSQIISHRKVKTGCIQCKKRHIKCDESRPACRNCVRYSSACNFSSSLNLRMTPNVPSLGFKSPECRLSSADDSKFSFADFELLHHWTVLTADSIAPNKDFQRAMREVIPRLAITHTYLMHAILALSSLHIAYLRPTESEQYLLFAAHHQSLALPLIRSALTSINEDNCHALFACGHIIAGYTFGSAKAPESLVFSSGLGVMSEFVPLLRGAFSVYDYALKWLSVGPLAFCLEKSLNESPEFSQNPDDACFARLLPLLYTNGDEDTYTCCEALNCLRRLLAMAATPNQTISARTLAYSWAAQVPPRYPVLICERKPEALVVMAYYCVMLRMIDSFWYMKGYAARLLDQCRRNLSDKWLRHIDWPLSIVGLPVDK